MMCTVCGSQMRATTTDLPFKVSDTAIVVVRAVPVQECANCPEYLIGDADMRKIEEILAERSRDAELELVRFAA